MQPDLVGYLWNCLAEDEQRRVAEQLATDPKLRDELAAVRERLAPLEWDRDPEPAPAGLAVDALARVAEHVCRDRQLPKAPPVTRSAGSERPWRRRIDVAVAVSVALTSIAILLPTILAWHERYLRVECQDNLRSMWTGLKEFQTVRRKLPDPGSVPRPVAGMVAPMLRDAGYLPRDAHLVCPATKERDSVGLTIDEIENLPPEQFANVAPRLMPGYAYALGYRDADGTLHPVDDMLREISAEQLPIIADAPAVVPAVGNSPNHVGNGQNLLFLDGHAGFHTTRTMGDDNDDIYLNRRNRTEAGVDAFDRVLGSSATRP
jgi:prepilin-type processing-associated H-X9-DG protein